VPAAPTMSIRRGDSATPSWTITSAATASDHAGARSVVAER
jgi:hypothetical protein